MIYTVTFNPSLDYVVQVEDFCPGRINRTAREAIFPGGKGLNVSRVLKHLGQESIALGFIAGFTGEEIRRKMEQAGCRCRFISVERGRSRINLKLRSREETEINGQGPEIGERELEAFFSLLEELQGGDFLVLAGSIPSCLSSDTYSSILERCQGKEIHFVVDAAGGLLMKALPFRPFLVKPNHHELGEIFGRELKTRQELVDCGRSLQELGAENVLISRAGDGALLLTSEGKILETRAPSGEVVNSVGAGDSMVAGFLAGYLESGDYGEAFYLGAAAGSATAFTEDLASGAAIRELRREMKS